MGKLTDILGNGDGERIRQAWNETEAAGEFGRCHRMYTWPTLSTENSNRAEARRRRVTSSNSK